MPWIQIDFKNSVKIRIYNIIFKTYIEVMDRNYTKILTETRAGRIIGYFVLYFSILLVSKFSRMKL